MKTAIYFLFLIFAFSNAKAEGQSSKDLLKEMTRTYKVVEFMKSNFVKKEESALLGDGEKIKGSIQFSKGNLRVEQKGEEREIFIKNKNHFWHLQGDRVVTGSSKKAVPNIFDLIFSDENIWNQLPSHYLEQSKKKAVVEINSKAKAPNIQKIIVSINTKKRTIEELVYFDDLQNKTSIDFSGTRFYSSRPSGRFSYSPKSSDKVSRL